MRNLLPNFPNSLDQFILDCWRTSFIEIQFVFYMLLNVFYDIQIRTLCRSGEEIDTILLSMICGDFGSMWGCIILLEDKWPIFITIDGRHALGGGGGSCSKETCFFALIFWSHTTNLPAPLGPMHPQNIILEGWLEKNSGFLASDAIRQTFCVLESFLRSNRHSSEKTASFQNSAGHYLRALVH